MHLNVHTCEMLYIHCCMLEHCLVYPPVLVSGRSSTVDQVKLDLLRRRKLFSGDWVCRCRRSHSVLTSSNHPTAKLNQQSTLKHLFEQMQTILTICLLALPFSFLGLLL